MGLFSLIMALLALVLTLIAFIPLLGWLNWLFIPFSVLTLALNIVFMFVDMGFRNAAKAGMIISLAAIVIGMFRLTLFWGLL